MRGEERCSKWVISACLRHYDAVPYLTMLLFCKSSAAVWPTGERGGEGKRTEKEKQGDAERNIWTETDIKKKREREIKRASDIESQRHRRGFWSEWTSLRWLCCNIFGQWVHAAKNELQPLQPVSPILSINNRVLPMQLSTPFLLHTAGKLSG